jgi:hypothetical protein
MILIPNEKTAQAIGSKNYKKYAPKFNIYYRPHAWANNGGTAPEQGYELENLSSDVYGEYCRWDESGDVKLAGEFEGIKKIDALILGNPSWDEIRGVFYKNGEIVFSMSNVFWATETGAYVAAENRRVVFNRSMAAVAPLARKLAPGEIGLDATDQNIIIIPLYIEADAFEFIFEGEGSLNKLYMGLETKIASPSAVSYGYKGNAKSGVTDFGVIYGVKYPPTRTFSASWDLLEDADRRVLERYMMDMQTAVPHFIAPVIENCFIPPMFAALSEDKLPNKKHARSWRWESFDLTWMEAN